MTFKVSSAISEGRHKLLRLWSRLAAHGSCECVICRHRFGRFLPYRNGRAGMSPLLRVLDIVGSDVENFECPWCGAHDRERHLFLYLRETGLLARLAGRDILHFAPERQLSRLLAEVAPARYVRCDLFPSSPDIARIDITAIPFADASFDLVLANHVMEHVADDRQALAEVRRVLRSGGQAILQTPYSARLHHSWSDPGIDTNEARFLAHGQEDHVRLYGCDIFDRFAAAGFEAVIGRHEMLLPGMSGARFGVNTSEPFMLFRKSDK